MKSNFRVPDYQSSKTQNLGIQKQTIQKPQKQERNNAVQIFLNSEGLCVLCNIWKNKFYQGKPQAQRNVWDQKLLKENNCFYCLKQHILQLDINSFMMQFYSEMHAKIRSIRQIEIEQTSRFIRFPWVFIQQSLFQKYSQSQNYYFTRDINEILSETVSQANVRFKDYLTLDDEDEFLKRAYLQSEYPQKILLLAEYYKFHTDIPRLFMEPTCTVLNKYYDKKRKFEYYRIAKIIEDENRKNPNRPPKGIVGEKPSPVNSLEQDDETEEQKQKNEHFLRDTLILKDLSMKKKNDHSQTLQEICKNLQNQTIDSRTVQEQEQSIFQIQLHQIELQKLNNFLNFIKKQQMIRRPSQHLPSEIEQLKTESFKSQSIEKYSRQGSLHYDPKLLIPVSQHLKSRDYQKNVVQIKQANIQQIQQPSSKQSSNANTPLVRSFEQDLQEMVMLKKLNSQIVSQVNKQQINQQIKNDQNHPINIISNQINPNFLENDQKGMKTEKPNLKLHNLQTIHYEQDNLDQDMILIKSGSQTHRPQSNTQNYFNSNKTNQISNQRQEKKPLENQNQKLIQQQVHGQQQIKKNKPEIQKLSLGSMEQFQNHLQQQQPLSNRSQQPVKQPNFQLSSLVINNSGSTTSRPSTGPKQHMRQISNQERIININININDNQNKAYIQQLIKQDQTHKKMNSDGKAIYLKDQFISPKDGVLFLDTSEQSGCNSERYSYGGMMELLFQKGSQQISPREIKRVQFPSGGQKSVYLQSQINPYLGNIKVPSQQSSIILNQNSPTFIQKRDQRQMAIDQVKLKQTLNQKKTTPAMTFKK